MSKTQQERASIIPTDASLVGKTRRELDFWLHSVGSPLLVLHKHSLVAITGNKGAQRFFAIDQDALHGATIEDLLGSEASRMLSQIWSNAPVGEPGEPFIIRALVQGQERLLMVQITKLVVDRQDVRLFSIVDAPPQGSVALVSWQEKIIEMLNWLPFGFEIATTDDQIQFANSQFNQLFGYSAHEIENIEDWWRLAYPDPGYRAFARQKWADEIAKARAEDREMTPFDLDVVTRSGAIKTIQFRHRTIGEFNTNLYLDVTSERAAARELKILSETDPLTGVMNRRCFFQEAYRHFDSERAHQFGVLVLDLDHFKAVNDAHGHAIGDLVLKEFTDRCLTMVRKHDFFARFGGEEFVILIHDHANRLYEIAERIRRAIAEGPFMLGTKKLSVTVSIGFAIRNPNEGIEQLLIRADEALYNAKKAGRNRILESKW